MTTMDPKTLAALRGSIAKWQAIVDGTGTDQGPKNCPLCQMFLKGPPRCADCPVYEKTKVTGCGITPYDDFIFAEEDDDTAGMVDAAQAELAFLKSLLPAEAKP